MSDPVDSALAARFQASMPEQPDSPCPPAEVLWSAVRGELTGDRLQALTAHLQTCALCGEALALSAELAAQAEPRMEAEPRMPLRSRRAQFGAAAVAMTALAAGLVLTLSQRDSIPTERLGTPQVIASRGEAADPDAIRAVSPDEQPRTDIRLAWTPVDGAVRYRVQVSREDLQPLFDRTVEQGTTLPIPSAIGERGPWVAGRDPASVRPSLLHWQVDAILPEGRVVSSPTFTLRVVDPVVR